MEKRSLINNFSQKFDIKVLNETFKTPPRIINGNNNAYSVRHYENLSFQIINKNNGDIFYNVLLKDFFIIGNSRY